MQDSGLMVELPDGKLFRLENPAGRVVEMPDGEVVEMLDGQVVEMSNGQVAPSPARPPGNRAAGAARG
jgi:hypothetical protein